MMDVLLQNRILYEGYEMKNIIIPIILCLGCLSCIKTDSEKKAADKIDNMTDQQVGIIETQRYYTKHYGFDECYGETAGGTPICFSFDIKIYVEKGIKKAEYNIDGFQTMRRFVCTLDESGDATDFVFDSYSEDDGYENGYEKGQSMFKITDKDDRKYISDFYSPVDGELVSKEYELNELEID